MADQEALEIVVSLKNLTEAGFHNLKGQIDSVDKKVQESSGHFGKFGSILQGIGQGIGQGIFGAIDSGLNGIIGVLGDSTRAYQEAQVSQAQLRTALENNIPAWDGNTDAIEKLMEARLKLGFDDEEQRASLALLVGATKNVTTAQAAELAAMDLARLKGISLADATTTITSAMGGRTAALKKLGIEVQKGATQEQILADITKVAGGQAEAYADTSAGKMVAAQIKVREAEEKVGKVTDQIVTAVMPALADSLSNIVDAAGPWLDQLGNAMPGILRTAGQAIDWVSQNVIPALGAAFSWWWTNIAPIWVSVFGYISNSVLPAFSKAVDWIAKNVMPTVRDVLQYIVQNVLPPFGTAINIIVKDVFPPLNAALSWIANVGLKEVETEFALLGDVVGPVVTAIVAGVQGITDALNRLNAALGNLKGAKTTAAGGVIYQMNQAGAGTGPSAPTTGSTGAGGTVTRLAAGALVKSRPGGTLALLAEAGENEWVIPQSRMGRASSGGGNHFHVHFESLVTPTPQQMRDVAHALESEFGRMFALRGTAALNGGF